MEAPISDLLKEVLRRENNGGPSLHELINKEPSYIKKDKGKDNQKYKSEK